MDVITGRRYIVVGSVSVARARGYRPLHGMAEHGGPLPAAATVDDGAAGQRGQTARMTASFSSPR